MRTTFQLYRSPVAFLHTVRSYKLQCHGPEGGGGGRGELRTECEFIHIWQTRWEKLVLLLPWLASLSYRFCWKKRNLHWCRVKNISTLTQLLHMIGLSNCCAYLTITLKSFSTVLGMTMLTGLSVGPSSTLVQTEIPARQRFDLSSEISQDLLDGLVPNFVLIYLCSQTMKPYDCCVLLTFPLASSLSNSFWRNNSCKTSSIPINRNCTTRRGNEGVGYS